MLRCYEKRGKDVLGLLPQHAAGCHHFSLLHDAEKHLLDYRKDGKILQFFVPDALRNFPEQD